MVALHEVVLIFQVLFLFDARSVMDNKLLTRTASGPYYAEWQFMYIDYHKVHACADSSQELGRRYLSTGLGRGIWWWRARRGFDNHPFSLAHAQNLHQIRVAEGTRLALQPLLPLQGILHLQGTLLFLLLQDLLGVLEVFDFLQQITPSFHGR